MNVEQISELNYLASLIESKEDCNYILCAARRAAARRVIAKPHLSLVVYSPPMPDIDLRSIAS